MTRSNQRRIAKSEIVQRRKAAVRRIIWVTGSALAVTASASALLLLNRTFSVSEWKIEVVESAPSSLHAGIDRSLASLQAYDFWSTRPAIIRNRLLQALPDLEEIHIQRKLTGSLHLHAVARTPVALWQKQEGKIWLVDRHGLPYRPLAANEPADLPVLRMGEADIVEVAALLQQLRAADAKRFSHVSELFASNSSWKINFDQGQQWMISRNENISDAIAGVVTLLEQPRWRSGHWRVDTRIKQRWFIRPTKHEGVI
ncbi:MAG: cell division protein FtsQ/DivIB [Mariprofundaceae bacterium]|nr:cell division protein FtsQ/DivIB [Mariprofundaceae bacterium]